MRLSDIVSAASGLAIYAEIAMVLFLAAFVTVLGQVFAKRRAAEWDRAASLALDDDRETATPLDLVDRETATPLDLIDRETATPLDLIECRVAADRTLAVTWR